MPLSSCAKDLPILPEIPWLYRGWLKLIGARLAARKFRRKLWLIGRRQGATTAASGQQDDANVRGGDGGACVISMQCAGRRNNAAPCELSSCRAIRHSGPQPVTSARSSPARALAFCCCEKQRLTYAFSQSRAMNMSMRRSGSGMQVRRSRETIAISPTREG